VIFDERVMLIVFADDIAVSSIFISHVLKLPAKYFDGLFSKMFTDFIG